MTKIRWTLHRGLRDWIVHATDEAGRRHALKVKSLDEPARREAMTTLRRWAAQS